MHGASLPETTVLILITVRTQKILSLNEYTQERQCTYNVILRCVRATNFAGEKQYVLHIASVCLQLYLPNM
jgi:hypothetical protein